MLSYKLDSILVPLGTVNANPVTYEYIKLIILCARLLAILTLKSENLYVSENSAISIEKYAKYC